jgi:hypothetical protein
MGILQVLEEHALKKDYGSALTSSLILSSSLKMLCFASTCASYKVCCLATGPKQWRQLIMDWDLQNVSQNKSFSL